MICVLPWFTPDWNAPSMLCANTPSMMRSSAPLRSCAYGPKICAQVSVIFMPCSGAHTFSALPSYVNFGKVYTYINGAFDGQSTRLTVQVDEVVLDPAGNIVQMT